MATIRDLAVGQVATAPSPATSGTTLVLNSGQGADMPTDVPFKLLAYPSGVIPTKANSERLLVTARSGDTLTILRAQGETTAKSIAAGWLVSNNIFTDDINNTSFVTSEVPVGTINGTNTAFTVASPYVTGSLRVFRNGIRLRGGGNDFTETPSGFTMVTAPATGSVLLVDYNVGSGALSVGTNSFISDETPTGAVNGSNTAFTTVRPYIAGTLEVFINGIKQARTTHVTETTPSTGSFTLDTAPLTGDIIRVNYQFNLNPSGNSDTVDGYHANATPTAGQIPVLDGAAKLPASVFPVQEAWQNATLTNGWVHFGGAYANVSYMKDSLGFVHLRGIMKSGTMGQVAFTLPVGYRPGAQIYQISASNGSVAICDIAASGTVTPQVGTNPSYSVDGITFRAEG